MPSCRVTNRTGKPLNVALKQVSALHFENGLQPGEEVKFRPGKVWFTLEALADDGTKASRYSITKSAATIALMSIAVGAVVITAGQAMLPAAAAGGAAAGAASAASYLSKASYATKAVLAKNAGTIGKISSVALPKAVEKLSAEVGGLSALQREVISIISSPTLSSDVRHKATDLLHNLHSAYKTDRAGTSVSAADGPVVAPAEGKKKGWGIFARSATPAPTTGSTTPPVIETDVIDDGLPPTEQAEDMVEEYPIATGETLRVHGIYMDRRRRFEIHVNNQGKLELWDADTNSVWSRHVEKQHDADLKKQAKEEQQAEKDSKKSQGKAKKGSIGEEDHSTASGTDEELGRVSVGSAKAEEGSVFSVELDSADAEMARVTETGGVRRRGTVKDRLQALVNETTSVPSQNAAGA